MEPYIGQILAVGFNYAPVGWLACDGQILPIADYDVLYALIGTTYGGDGATTFAVPNLNGRVAIGSGQAPGRSTRVLGEVGGSENVTLSGPQVGAHRHRFMASSGLGTVNTPAATQSLATSTQAAASVYAPSPATVAMSPAAIKPSGAGAPHENRQPYQVINYIIAFQGVFPSPS